MPWKTKKKKKKAIQLVLPTLNVMIQKCTKVCGSVPTLHVGSRRAGQRRTFFSPFMQSVAVRPWAAHRRLSQPHCPSLEWPWWALSMSSPPGFIYWALWQQFTCISLALFPAWEQQTGSAGIRASWFCKHASTSPCTAYLAETDYKAPLSRRKF